MSVRIKGADKLLRKLGTLGKVARTINRKAVRAGTTVLGRAVRSEVPVDEGVLKRAQTTNVSNRGMSARGKAGADTAKLDADERRPSNIDWLVEYGHVAPDGTFVPPSGAMRRAEANAMPAAEAAYIAKLKSELEKELAR